MIWRCRFERHLYVCSASLTRNVRLNSKWHGNCKSSCNTVDIGRKYWTSSDIYHGMTIQNSVHLMDTVKPLKKYWASLVCISATETLATPGNSKSEVFETDRSQRFRQPPTCLPFCGQSRATPFRPGLGSPRASCTCSFCIILNETCDKNAWHTQLGMIWGKTFWEKSFPKMGNKGAASVSETRTRSKEARMWTKNTRHR